MAVRCNNGMSHTNDYYNCFPVLALFLQIIIMEWLSIALEKSVLVSGKSGKRTHCTRVV